jgi:ectoine hydroxylase-related dioxygenase (phytanoyl-CoA dioxygenase family)
VLTATAPAGSVLVFNGQCWHGGGANTGDRDRHAIFGHYRISPMMRFQLDPHHRFPEEWLDLLTDRQKQLLRMENGVGVPHGADHYE